VLVLNGYLPGHVHSAVNGRTNLPRIRGERPAGVELGAGSDAVLDAICGVFECSDVWVESEGETDAGTGLPRGFLGSEIRGVLG
jgi:hypothetical protein